MEIHKWKNNELNKLLMEKFGLNEKKEEDSEIKNKDKADLDDDGKLSGYEKKRAKAIEDSMAEQGKEGEDEEEGDEKEATKMAKGKDADGDKKEKKKNEGIYRKKVRKILSEAFKRRRE